jgi:hypothetical protein
VGSNNKHHSLLHRPQQVLKSLADHGIVPSIKEMMMAAGARIWVSTALHLAPLMLSGLVLCPVEVLKLSLPLPGRGDDRGVFKFPGWT